MRKSLRARVWAWSRLEQYGFQKHLVYKFTSMQIYYIHQYPILNQPDLTGPIVSPVVRAHLCSKMYKTRGNSPKKTTFKWGCSIFQRFSFKTKNIFVYFFRAASLESSRYLVLSITATVVFLVLKDWSEEVVLFLSRALKILTQTITPPKFNMEPKSDGFQKESLIPGCHFQIIFRFHVKLWEVIQKVSENAGITWWSRVMQD